MRTLRLIGKNVEDKHIALADIANLSELDLSNTKVTGAGLATIKNSKRLTKLSLAGTAVDDAALKNIDGLTNLMSINLYNTKVTDAGLASPQEHEVPAQGLRLAERHHREGCGGVEKGTAEDVDVNLGFKLAKVEPKEEKKEEVKQVSFNKKYPVSGKDIDPTKLYTITSAATTAGNFFTKDPAKHVAKLKGSDKKKCIFRTRMLMPARNS